MKEVNLGFSTLEIESNYVLARTREGADIDTEHHMQVIKEVEKQIAIKNAEIKVEEAKGIAKSQEIINKTLTTNYLQHEAIQAQMAMAHSKNHTTVYIPSGANGIPLIRTIK